MVVFGVPRSVFPNLCAVQSDPKAGVVKGGHFAHAQSGLDVGACLLRKCVGLTVVIEEGRSGLVKVDCDLHGAARAVVGVGDLGAEGVHLFDPRGLLR